MDKHFIVLNGNRYDAVTGALLGPENKVSDTLIAKTPQTAPSVDGAQTTSSHRPAASPSARTKPEQSSTPQTPKQPARSHHNSSHHVAHHKPQDSKTLMRRAVQKPSAQKKTSLKQQYPIITTKSGVAVEAPKRLAHNVDPSRIARAQAVSKSHHVGRFQSQSIHAVKPQVIPISVKEHSSAVTAPAAPKRPQSTPKKIDIFEQAIATATSHTQKPPKRASTRRRVANVSAVFGAVLVMGGFIFALNQPAIEMQLASFRAGFDINEPRYTPTGYSKTTSSVAGKSVALNYESVNGSYTLKQESSDWNSQTLFDHINANHGSDYSVVYSNGQVIYLYGENEASWVNGGILYTISSSNILDSEEIAEIAASL